MEYYVEPLGESVKGPASAEVVLFHRAPNYSTYTLYVVCTTTGCMPATACKCQDQYAARTSVLGPLSPVSLPPRREPVRSSGSIGGKSRSSRGRGRGRRRRKKKLAPAGGRGQGKHC
jgi:hypothetical protein